MTMESAGEVIWSYRECPAIQASYDSRVNHFSGRKSTILSDSQPYLQPIAQASSITARMVLSNAPAVYGLARKWVIPTAVALATFSSVLRPLAATILPLGLIFCSA